MHYSEWISAVADRLIELGVPIDEVIDEEVTDFPWFKERFEDDALAEVTGDEYFHLLMNVGLEDSAVLIPTGTRVLRVTTAEWQA
jgi:hypothetical protein